MKSNEQTFGNNVVCGLESFFIEMAYKVVVFDAVGHDATLAAKQIKELWKCEIERVKHICFEFVSFSVLCCCYFRIFENVERQWCDSWPWHSLFHFFAWNFTWNFYLYFNFSLFDLAFCLFFVDRMYWRTIWFILLSLIFNELPRKQTFSLQLNAFIIEVRSTYSQRAWSFSFRFDNNTGTKFSLTLMLSN